MRPTKKTTAKKSSEKVLEKLSSLENLLKKKDDKPFNFKEACAYLGFAPSYLYKLTYRKIIPHYKPSGKMLFFSKAELDEWIFKNRDQKSEDRNQNEDEEDEEDASDHSKYDYE
ncbi:MAG: helix-turn-helix domain-containing protein [Stygiobacter sp.]|nr:helix-turn-helix domain-containing protein [Ignavibacteriales bacterium]